MNKLALYSQASDVQRRDATEIVKKYAPTLKLNSVGKRALLDVGTGTGDVLMEILVPQLAPNFITITGIDVSPDMVEHAVKTYGSLPGVSFKQFNIEDKHLPLEFYHQFDRVTSFFCLHWVRDQKQALENIFNCLRRNGDCLLIFPGAKSTSDAYKMLAKNPRWHHVKDMREIFSPLLEYPRVEEEFESMLREVGFVGSRVDSEGKQFAYDGIENFKKNMRAVDPFDLSEAEFGEYFIGMCDCFDAMGLREKIPGKEDFRFIFKYRLVVAYAKKGH